MTSRDEQPATAVSPPPRRPRSNLQPTGARTDRADILAEHIRQLVDAAPPLRAEQIEQLRGLLPAPATETSSLTRGLAK